MQKVDIILAQILIKLVNDNVGSIDKETATRIYSIIGDILKRYGYKIPDITGNH